MDWNQVKGNWTKLTGEVKSKWGELTDDEAAEIAGERDKLVGWVQEKYGESKDAAEAQVDEWMESDAIQGAMAKLSEATDEAKDKLNNIG